MHECFGYHCGTFYLNGLISSHTQNQLQSLKSVTLPNVMEGSFDLDLGNLVFEPKETSERILEGEDLDLIPRPVDVNMKEGTITVFLHGF